MKTLSENPIRAFQPIISKLLANIAMKCLCLGLLNAALLHAASPLEEANPIKPLPKPPLGISASLSELKEPPSPERVRLGRWLFYDKRLSADGSVSCASCHQSEHAFSESTPNSTGIRGQKGGRKAPSFVNQAWTLYPHFFWDGRAGSLEEQALGPIANPIEMGNTHEAMIKSLNQIAGYKPSFKEAFGTEEITKERVAKAIADYERTRMSGNSPWDKWKNGDESAVPPSVKKGNELFFEKAMREMPRGREFHRQQFSQSRHRLGGGSEEVQGRRPFCGD